MVERGVNHRVGRGAAQRVKVVERAAQDLRAGRGERGRLVIGTGEADHLVAGGEQLLYHGRADPSRGAEMSAFLTGEGISNRLSRSVAMHHHGTLRQDARADA